ncbi:F-box protein PP2-B3 [Zostera marina]|uniref:F-box protein PP2-B3 n=1 Tax=Zostera marina TaxID=29655 RepID=A0A0K9PRQ7_ZOSMR|nr:F-box protein PP2-B3 [Zostera marina]
MLNSLPEDCISRILSLTTPQDTCIFATLSSFFRSVAESDQVWQQFLPSNYEDVLSRAEAPIPMHISSKKDLFFYLCDPILINDGKNSIALDKTTGKICYMISAKELINDQNMEYLAIPESR